VGALEKSMLLSLLDSAQAFKERPREWPSYPRLVLGALFYAPSTRTLVGFQSAAARLGGSTVVLTESRFGSGMSDLESLDDTVRVVSSYVDVIVLRHPNADALDRIAGLSSVPVINGGNGTEEHPTQAIIDLLAIRNWHRRLEGLRLGIVGDLRNSRSAHSLVRAMALFEPKELRLIAPPGRQLPSWVLTPGELPITSFEDGLHLRDLDVLYMAGLPEGEGKEQLAPAERAKFSLTQESARELPANAVILCPLPRIDEIDAGLDSRPNARYFDQSADGLFVRMAILHHVLQSVQTEKGSN
jgi:aspartate carbamoyltransferase catalytic subunit